MNRNSLLYHNDQVLGIKGQQLCLPVCRRTHVMGLAHQNRHRLYGSVKYYLSPYAHYNKNTIKTVYTFFCVEIA